MGPWVRGVGLISTCSAFRNIISGYWVKSWDQKSKCPPEKYTKNQEFDKRQSQKIENTYELLINRIKYKRTQCHQGLIDSKLNEFSFWYERYYQNVDDSNAGTGSEALRSSLKHDRKIPVRKRSSPKRTIHIHFTTSAACPFFVFLKSHTDRATLAPWRIIDR